MNKGIEASLCLIPLTICGALRRSRLIENDSIQDLVPASLEVFSRGLAEGDTQLDAYRAAGYRGDRQAAGRLARRADIKARVVELKMPSPNPRDNLISVLLQEIEGARVMALMADPPQANAAIQATLLKARISGYGVTVRKQERAITRASLEILGLNL